MAHFRGTAQGERSIASRLGHKKTGLVTTCNGWNVGVKCCAGYDEENDRDVIYVYQTGGSNGAGESKLLAIVTDKPEAESADRGGVK